MMDKKMWHCEIGEVDGDKIPMGGDYPMRVAVAKAFKDLTGEDNIFIFSGWGNKLSEGRRAVVESRVPNRDKVYSEILTDIPTADLIAELEKRRPCFMRDLKNLIGFVIKFWGPNSFGKEK